MMKRLQKKANNYSASAWQYFSQSKLPNDGQNKLKSRMEDHCELGKKRKQKRDAQMKEMGSRDSMMIMMYRP